MEVKLENLKDAKFAPISKSEMQKINGGCWWGDHEKSYVSKWSQGDKIMSRKIIRHYHTNFWGQTTQTSVEFGEAKENY